MPADKIETFHGSVIQHGPHNDRIYLMHLNTADTERLIKSLDVLAADCGYGKIFAKIPASCWQLFLAAGYVKEATVPGFFNGATDGFFIAKFFSSDRRKAPAQAPNEHPIGPPGLQSAEIPSVGGVEYCSSALAEDMAALYREVFESYAFPIHRPSYLRRMMEKHVVYFGVRMKARIAALAAAEVDDHSQTCEMTDFATLPEYRGKGLAGYLLDFMETDVCHRGTKTAYTIARADSPGINRVFQKRGYRFAGCLAKNTQIGGRIRSMNIWYKKLIKGK